MNVDCEDPFITNRLFCDYLFNFEKVQDFYKWNPYAGRDWTGALDGIVAYSFDRRKLVEILKKQNQRFGCGQKTLHSIDTLADDRSFVVITGQQAGLLSGPLLTIYKTITTIKLTEQLNKKHKAHFLPVFWVVSDDHDFEEINHINVLNADNTIERLAYQLPHPSDRCSTGKIQLESEFKEFYDRFSQRLRETEFKDSILDMVKASYVEGRSICEGFCRLMAKLFQDYDLVLVDPLDQDLMKLAAPMYEQEITDPHRSTAAVLQTNQRLQEYGYHQQVHVRPGYLNLFLDVDGPRSTLSVEGDVYQAGGKTFTQNELLRILNETPNRFSPSVILRPIVRSHLLPTVAYVGGPAEISYLAQMKMVFETFGVPPPVVFPRSSVTLVEKKIRRIVVKHNISLVELFKDTESVITKRIEDKLPETFQTVFQSAHNDAQRIFSRIRDAVVPIDDSLEDVIVHSRNKLTHDIGKLEKKVIQSKKKSEEILVQQIRRASSHLFPNNMLQERVLNIMSYLVLYGPELIHRLYETMDAHVKEHQMIDVG